MPLGSDAIHADRILTGGVMVESSPTAALIVTQAEFLFQFLVIPFDNPALFGNGHKRLQPSICG